MQQDINAQPIIINGYLTYCVQRSMLYDMFVRPANVQVGQALGIGNRELGDILWWSTDLPDVPNILQAAWDKLQGGASWEEIKEAGK